jgi:NADPH:quinone reductase-like Zn-dependent oxidoreductase
MKAIVYHRYGGPDVLKIEEIKRPIVTKGNVVVRIMAASVNPADWQIRSGKRFRLAEPFCTIPGLDFSGVVEEADKDTGNMEVGMRVFGKAPLTMEEEGRGSYAEFVAVPAGAANPMPEGMTFEEAAALPVAVLTAWNALFVQGGLSSGQTALIHAAAGGVGHTAVQLAKAAGARIYGTASGRNQDFLREIGVDVPIDYETERIEDVVKDADVVFDSIIHDARPDIDLQAQETQLRSWQVLKKGGILVSITGTPDAAVAAQYGVRSAYAFAYDCPEALAYAASLYQTGKLMPHISAVFSLEQAVQAHALSETGHTRGKIIIKVGT